jgi:hypothetical protein
MLCHNFRDDASNLDGPLPLPRTLYFTIPNGSNDSADIIIYFDTNGFKFYYVTSELFSNNAFSLLFIFF